MSDVGLSHVALPVTDLERSVVFYQTYGKLRVVHRRPDVVWLADGTRPFVVVLIEKKAVPHPLLPVAHLGIGCASLDELEGLCARARAEAVLLEGPQDLGPPVGTYAFLRDPDGHTLELSFGQDVDTAVGASRA